MTRSKVGTAEEGDVKSSLAALAEAARGESNASPLPGWTLPSGEDLLNYALKGGFLAPAILRGDAGHTAHDHVSQGSKGKE